MIQQRIMVLFFLVVIIPIALIACASPADLREVPAVQSAPEEKLTPPSALLPEHSEEEAAPKSSQEQSSDDRCGNDLGNGEEIIAGPSVPEQGDRDNPFHSLTVHPTNPNVLFLGTERNGLLKTADGGKTWERLRKGFRHDPSGYPEIYDIAIAPSNDAVMYAATTSGGPGPLTGNVPSANGGIYKSNDGGKTWQRKNCGLTTGWVLSVWVDPKDERHVVAGASGGKTSFSGQNIPQGTFVPGGPAVSFDGGETWKIGEMPATAEKFAYPQVASMGKALLTTGFNPYAPESVGFLKSTDGGSSWQSISPQLPNAHQFAVSGEQLYALGDSLLAASSDQGNTWKKIDFRTSGYAIAVSPADAKRIVYATSEELFLSTNGLDSSVKVLTHQGGHFTDIVFAPNDPQIVYAVTLGYVIYKSSDGGKTFEKLGSLREEVLN